MFRKICLTLAAVAALGLAADDGFAAKKKGGLKKRSDYTAEQRAQIHARALQICRKAYGSTTKVRVNYATGSILCWL